MGQTQAQEFTREVLIRLVVAYVDAHAAKMETVKRNLPGMVREWKALADAIAAEVYGE